MQLHKGDASSTKTMWATQLMMSLSHTWCHRACMRSNHMTSVVTANKTTRPRSKHKDEDHVAFVLAMRTTTGPTYNQLLSDRIASVCMFQFFCKVN